MQEFIETLSEIDLEAINKLTLKPLQESEVYAFRARLITDEKTFNGRIWTKEWQEANVSKFVGTPVMVEHEKNIQTKIGIVYAAEMEENSIIGSIFIPQLDDEGIKNRQKVETGLFSNVSINASGKAEKFDDHIKIHPTDGDRVFEVSMVAVPGCERCEVLKENAEEEVEEINIKWVERAKQLQACKEAEYLKHVKFCHPKANLEFYRQLAESFDPATLENLTKDLAELYEHNSPAPIPDSGIANALDNIRNTKGD